MIKILYFDTSAVVKYFCKEEGSELVKWIVDNKVVNSFALYTSQITLFEFPRVLDKKVKNGVLTTDRKRWIIAKARYCFSRIFRIRDFKHIPGFGKGKDTTYIELCERYGLSFKKYGWDTRHLACVINYLRCCRGHSRARILSSDSDFMKMFKQMSELKDFDLIDPTKITKDEFLYRVNYD